MKFVGLDLETTSTETGTATVVQAAVVVVEGAIDDSGRVSLDWGTERVQKIMCYAEHIPPGATEVHGITAADVADCKPFEVYVSGLAKSLMQPDTIVVTFNGAGYDLVIVERYLGFPLVVDHVDVYRAWMYDRNVKTKALWRGVFGYPDDSHERQFTDEVLCSRAPIMADVFSGSLGGAHAFYTGECFDGAHDAAIDCRSTLRVFAEMKHSLDALRTMATSPLPGCVDFSGKLVWNGDRACISFGKHRGVPIEAVPRDYLSWMTSKGDFPRDTCNVVLDYLRGNYPRKT
jgi:DNA polymerase III epsilon subunit-like protein